MMLRSAMAALNSLAFIFARTAARSGASRVVGVSTAFMGDTRAGRRQSVSRVAPHTRISVELLMVNSLIFILRAGAGGAATNATSPPRRYAFTGVKAYPLPSLAKAPAPGKGK